MNCLCKTTASARLWLYLKRLCLFSSAIAYCISSYASFYAGLSCVNNSSHCRLALLMVRQQSISWRNAILCFVRRNATHCISPYVIVVCVCVSVCLSICVYVCVYMLRLWTSGKWFEIETSFLYKLLGITLDKPVRV